MICSMKKLLIVIVLTFMLLPYSSSTAPVARALGDGSLEDFQPIGPGQGWLLFSGHLFWTTNNGGSWQEISPPLTGSETIQSVDFLDPVTGKALLGDGTNYTLAASTDGGQTWTLQAINLVGLADSPTPPAMVHMGWLDIAHGWLAFKMSSGSSFSIGMLYVTDDGGQNWQRRRIPLGEPVAFASNTTGWTAGGAAGDELYRTQDGGQSWESQQPGGPGVHYLLPKFDDAQTGLLPVVAGDADTPHVDFYRTTDGGQNWSLLGSQPLAAGTAVSNDLPLTLLDSTNFVLAVPQSDQFLRSNNLQFQSLTNTDGASAAIGLLRMVSLDSGWAQSDTGSCTPAADGSATCTQETKLLSTSDGGLTWQVVPLPIGGAPSVVQSFSVADKSAGPEAVLPLDADTQPYTGQGFDKCGLPSVSNMQSWWNSSPYNGFNLYIGGSVYACRNTLPTASYVTSLNSQGWRFFPTWVGPQAPCWRTDLTVARISTNTSTAYSQGISEADAAMATAANLGLAAPDGSGSVIYYDIETYSPSDTTCVNAVNSFISGWTYELRAHNNLSGVYGSSCYNASSWWGIPNVPDAVWLAHWYMNPAYLPTATTADSCISSSLWSNHQRLRQYAGDHTEVWGGTSLGGIDSNALDGPLTVKNGTANSGPPSMPLAANPPASSTVARGTDTWLTWKTTGTSCTVHAWGNGLDVSSSGICSIYHLGPQLPGLYSWQVIASNAIGTTIGPIFQFGVAPNSPGTLSASLVGSTQVNLNWVLSSDDPTYVDGYQIYADGVLVGTVGRGINSFQVYNLSCNTAHSFYVTATLQGIVSVPSNVATLTTPTCAPTLLGPADGSIPLSLRPTFTWQAVPQATGYVLQVSLAQDFSNLNINASVAGTSFTAPADLIPTTLYYWRARSTGAFGNSEWSPVRSFTTPVPPPIPGLTWPGVNALVTDYSPLLDFTEPNLADGSSVDHYQVQVAATSGFTPILYDEQTQTTEFQVPSDLQPNTTYYWRVRAFNSLGQYTAWADTWYFRTAITPPVLVSPTDGTKLLTRQLTLDWSDVSGADGYAIAFSSVPDFSTLIKFAKVGPSTYTVTSDLPANRVVYWRVRARGANGPSLWSSTWSFTTGNPPSLPALQFPANGALLTSYQPTLNWSDSTLPAGTTLDRYELQLSTDSAFNNLVYNESTSVSQFPLPAPLAPNARYYWRVRVFNTDGHYTTWTSARYFKAAILPPGLSLPDNGTQLLTRRLTFDWDDVVGASGYYLRISRYPNFSSVLFSANTTTSTYAVLSDLPANLLLYWEVRAKGSNGPSLYSEVRTFTTGNPPSIPSLLSPASNAFLTSYQPTLDWSDSTVPVGTTLDHYEVQLGTDTVFSAPVYDALVPISKFTPPAPIPPNDVYYWRVRAFNTAGNYSSWSPTRSFRAAIQPPTLLLPNANEVLSIRKPVFDWSDVAGATSYIIQVSRYSNFSSTLLNVKVTASTYTSSVNLPTGVTLYWRVRANGPLGPSLWAELPSRAFKIVIP